LPDNVDVVFIGAITVIGGPHARCYPEDTARYFDYVLGFTDKGTHTVRLILDHCDRTPDGAVVTGPQAMAVAPECGYRRHL
jgi:hypothetical protein